MAGRGILTDAVRELARTELGIDITTDMLRFMPYIMHCAINHQSLDVNKFTIREYGIFQIWKDKGWVSGGMEQRVKCSDKFWDSISMLIFLAYADADDIKTKEWVDPDAIFHWDENRNV